MDNSPNLMNAPFLSRLARLKARLAQNNLEGIILVPGPNMRYLTGINSLLMERPFLMFIPREGSAHLVAPTLESGPYVRSPLQIVVHSWDDGEGPSRSFEKLTAELDLNGAWGVEGRVPFRFTHELLKHTHSNLRDAEAICQGIRVTKDSAEIRSLQRAASILSKSFLKIPHLLKVGLTEVQLAQQISQTIYSSGAEFVTDILVQSGAFAADPHHLPSARRLKRKESIVIDTACSYSGYYADITRTFNIGHTPELEGIYENVLAAEEAAIKASKSGVAVSSIDAAARNHLKRAKLDGYFIHRTGHGLGLEVHEAPYIVADGAEIIQPSMAFTIEPGVYLPGKMGVRIEDDVLSTSQNCRVLTRTLPKEFEWWK